MKPIIPPPVITLALGAAIYLTTRAVDLAPFAFDGQRYVAIALLIAGLGVDAISVAAFFRAKTTVNPLAPAKAGKLVVSGFYKLSRNPMYLGMLLILVAAFVFLGEAVNAAYLAAFVILMNEMQIKPEEKALEEKFGDDYRAYKKRVRRWV
jgi:protein-S-isoprenylcysteine O-methyltransferase Ste14